MQQNVIGVMIEVHTCYSVSINKRQTDNRRERLHRVCNIQFKTINS